MPTTLRRAVERRSHPVLSLLRRQPPWLPLVAVLGLLVGGLFTHGAVGVLPLGIVALVVGWLTYLAWPVISAGGRIGRLLVLALLVAAALSRAGAG